MSPEAAAAHARVVPEAALVQIAVLQRLFGTHPFVGVPAEQLQQQLLGVVVLGNLADHLHVARLHLAILRDVATRRVACGAHLVKTWRAEYVDYFVDLFERVGRQEKDLAVEQLAVDAAHAPHVHREVVVFGAEEELRCAVVLRDHLLGHVAVLVHLDDSRQPKVAYLQQAIAVYQQVARLNVAVNYPCRMKVFYS